MFVFLEGDNLGEKPLEFTELSLNEPAIEAMSFH